MDKVFVKPHRKAGKPPILKGLLSNKNKATASESSELEENSGFFPFGGGDYEALEKPAYQPITDNYEPESSMVDSSVQFQEDPSHKLRRNMRRILVRGSKYEVQDASDVHTQSKISPVPIVSEYDSILADHGLKWAARPKSHPTSRQVSQQGETMPSISSDTLDRPSDPASTSNIADTDFFSHLPSSVSEVVALIHKLAYKSVMLRPIEMAANYLDDFMPFVSEASAAMELWLFMLAAYLVASITHLVCQPAVLILKAVIYFLA